MADKRLSGLMEILQNPAVQKAVKNVNLNLVERRAFQLPICNVFSFTYRVAEENERLQFNEDFEAEHQLWNISNNKVEVGADASASEGPERCHRCRNIGIVFLGGPMPGGHNVIADIFDAAKQANSENRGLGVLVGPDEVIENESIVITRELVGASRNLGGFTRLPTEKVGVDEAPHKRKRGSYFKLINNYKAMYKKLKRRQPIFWFVFASSVLVFAKELIDFWFKIRQLFGFE